MFFGLILIFLIFKYRYKYLWFFDLKNDYIRNVGMIICKIILFLMRWDFLGLCLGCVFLEKIVFFVFLLFKIFVILLVVLILFCLVLIILGSKVVVLVFFLCNIFFFSLEIELSWLVNIIWSFLIWLVLWICCFIIVESFVFKNWIFLL